MKITNQTTIEELLAAGFTVTSPRGFKVRGDVEDSSIAKRMPTPAGEVACGYYPLSPMGVYAACGDINGYEEALAGEHVPPGR